MSQRDNTDCTRNPAALIELALEHHRAGRLPEAEAVYRRMLADNPSNSRAVHLLGIVAHQSGHQDEALTLIRRSIELNPSAPDFHNNLGTILASLGRQSEAEAAFRVALSLQPEYQDAAVNLINAMREQCRFEEAICVCHDALQRWPLSPEVHNALGVVLECQNRVEDALACFEKAIQVRFDYVQARKNRAMVLLKLGDFKQGWPEYEWRLREGGMPYQRRWPKPRWNGSGLSGRTVLLHTEGGMGNVMHFARYAPLLARKAGHVVLECPPPLKRLLQTLEGVERIIGFGEPLPPFDCHCPLVSFPAMMGTTLENVPADVPYLKAERELIAFYGQQLASDPQLSGAFRVGICWQGNPRFPQDGTRSIPLRAFTPLAAIPGVRLVSLQQGPGIQQLDSAAFPVSRIPSPPEPADGAFTNTAALMMNLDLVITSDTSIAHLAGALGVPVWVALSFTPCWRWMLNRADSPWYPSMRLFRQAQPGDWDSVFRQIAEHLAGAPARCGRSPRA